MPFREKRIDGEGGKTRYEIDEEFLPNFLAETEEEAVALYEEYKHTINFLSRQYALKSRVDRQGLFQQDLFQEGLIGLARAKRDFDPKRGEDFNTYAIYLIRNALREAVYAYEMPIVVPAYLREVNYYYSKIIHALETIGLPEDAIEEITWNRDARAEDIGLGHLPQSALIDEFKEKIINRAEANKIGYKSMMERALSIPKKSEVNVYRPDFNDAKIEYDDEALDKRAALERVSKLIGSDTFEVLCMHYVDGHTLDYIGKVLGLSTGRISQIITEAKDTLADQKEFIMDGKAR